MQTRYKHLLALVQRQGVLNTPLARYTTWRMGGPADLLLEPQDEQQLAAVLAFCRQEQLPLLLMAGGSNLLCHDAGLRGVAVRLPGGGGTVFGRMQRKGETIVAGAGCSMPELARFAASQGLSGLEHAGNIPGSLGGLVTMNGGSLRRSISESLLRVFALSPEGEPRAFAPHECGFAYRTSMFQNNGHIVTGALLQLQEDKPKAIMRRIEEDLQERRRKFPLEAPSCGSVFKSHPGLYEHYGPPGKVIEDSGLKGERRGAVQVSLQHANFFVNLGQGLAAEAQELMAYVREVVQRRTGVAMECEVRFVDQDGLSGPAHEFLK